MAQGLKPGERLVQIGQTALRAPDGSFLPSRPLYIVVEAAEADSAAPTGAADPLTDIAGIFADKFAQYVKGARATA